MANWITDSQDEQSIEELFRDADQIHIPIFQREYVWKKLEFDNLIHDIELIKDSIENSQFLGAIVAYERPRPVGVVGRMRVLDVVDGQQRLLTLYIFILAIAERIHYYDVEIASEIIQEFLLLSERRGLSINTRIVPSFKDRNQFRALWDRVNTPELMMNILKQNPPKPPLPSGSNTGSLEKQYGRIIKWLKLSSPSEPESAIIYLRELLDIITRNLTFVHLKLTDASVATKIFERLNFRGVKVSVVDLVRNEVFSRSSQDAQASLEIYETVWRPFESRFELREDGFFFPYCLIHNSNIKKSELFSELRLIWKGFNPAEIVDHMTPYQEAYMAISTGQPSYSHKPLNDVLKRLFSLRMPSALYPFVMKLLCETKQGEVQENLAINTLNFIESFLVRRAILGFEPTGLHALFKGMWNDVKESPTDSAIKTEILKRPTIQYPSNREILEALKTRPLAKSRICNYLLREYDKSLPGDNPSDKITIEHILPQSYEETGEWAEIFSKDEHKLLKDVFANLIPLSSPLNSSIQAASYKKKRKRYEKESMFVTPRHFADKYEVWNIENLEKRTQILYDWTIKRWSE